MCQGDPFAVLKRILVIVNAGPGEFIALTEVLCYSITHLGLLDGKIRKQLSKRRGNKKCPQLPIS